MAAKKKQKKIAHKKTKTNPQGAGAKIIVIDWDTVAQLCKIQCTGEEIASVLDINYETLERACKREKKIKFVDYITQKKKGGKASLRRNQWRLAQDGNPTMLIWLGKQYLDQKDKQDFSSEDGSMSPPDIRINFKK